MSLPEPDDQFWSDPVWAGGSQQASSSSDPKAKPPKNCYRCKAATSKGATISFADGSKAFFCKPCAEHKLAKRASLSLPPPTAAPIKNPSIVVSSPPPVEQKRSSGHEKICVMCRKIGGAGARITLASGQVEWFCKQCALKPALARTESAILGSYAQAAPPAAATAAAAAPASAGALYNSSALISRPDPAAPPPVRTVSQEYMASIPAVDAAPMPAQTVPARSAPRPAAPLPSGSPRAAAAASPASGSPRVAAAAPPASVSPRVAAPPASSSPRAVGSPRAVAAPAEPYQSARLLDRERLGRGFEQCLIASDELQRAEQVGAGTQGLVFRGRWRALDVAIKERRDVAPEQLEQFRAEALKMHAVSSHENVCQFLGVVLQPAFAIVTRFYALGALEDYVYKNRDAELVALTRPTVRRVLLGVARGVRHLHRLGVVHRDIACRNVLLDDVSARYTAEMRAAEQCDGDAAVIDAVITDFGMSRAGGALGGVSVANFGPIKHMAPEQLEEQRYSGASDVYAFGVLCGELLERAPPMLGIDMVDAAQYVVNGTRGDIAPPPHADMLQLVRWCWETDPSGRPSMGDVVKAIKIMPLDAFAVPPTAPSKAERKARGEANKLALAAQQLALQQRLLRPPAAAAGAGARPPSPSLRSRLGQLLRLSGGGSGGEAGAETPPLSPTREASPRRNPLFGVTLQAAIDADGTDAHGVPLLLAQCMAMLRAHRQHSTMDLQAIVDAAASAAAPSSPRTALRAADAVLVMHVEGIFRLSGSSAQIERVKKCAADGGAAARQALMLISDPHTIAGVLKMWLRELTDRVIDVPTLAGMLDAMRAPDVAARCKALRLVIDRAAPVRGTILEQLAWIFQSIVTHTAVTRMTPHALAVVFAPSLADCSLAQTKATIELLAFLIDNALDVFDMESDQSYAFLPAKESTAPTALADSERIRAQFVDRNKGVAVVAPLPVASSYGSLPPPPPPPQRTPSPRAPLAYGNLAPELAYGQLPPET